MTDVKDSEYKIEEGWYETDDNHHLYRKTWLPSGDLKARLVFVHGYSDHCNNFGDFFPDLAKRGIAVYTWDQRGWGQSVKKPGDKGLTGPTERVMADITGFINTVPTDAPLFLMGHSMGGGQVLTYAARGPIETRKKLRGYLVEAPLVRIAPEAQPWRITEIAGRFAARVRPQHQMINKLKVYDLCRDRAVCEKIAADSLCHDTGTLQGLAGMLDRGKALDEGSMLPKEDPKSSSEQGLWICSGSMDKTIDHAAVKRLFDRIEWEDKIWKEYRGWYHILHREPQQSIDEVDETDEYDDPNETDVTKGNFTNHVIKFISKRL